MEVLINLFYTLRVTIGQRLDPAQIYLFALMEERGRRSGIEDWMRSYLRLLSQHDLLFWNDLARFSYERNHSVCFEQLLVSTDYQLITKGERDSEHDAYYTQLMARHWLAYQRGLLQLFIRKPVDEPQGLQSVLLLQRTNSRAIGNWRELAALAQLHGFELAIKLLGVSQISEVLGAVAVVRLLLAVNSASFNAVFMPPSSAVLEIDAVTAWVWHGWSTFTVGYHFLGMHPHVDPNTESLCMRARM